MAETFPNYNRIIDIRFRLASGQAFDLKTPRRGRKPNISISGQLGAKGYAENFEIRVVNLYCDDLEANLSAVEVSAGYLDNVCFAISGTVQAAYVEKPGPDKETVIQCVTAIYSPWIDATIDLRLSPGSSVADFAAAVSSALGYDEPEVDGAVSSLSLECPFLFSGRASEAISRFRRLFPGLAIIPSGRTLRAYPTDKVPETTATHRLGVLSQAPQFSGGVVNISAPWDPRIRPGDVVQFPTTFAKKSVGALTYGEAVVNMIHFDFGTVGSTNSMTIMGTPTSSAE